MRKNLLIKKKAAEMFRPIFGIALFISTVWLVLAQQQPSEADTLKKIRESLNVNMFSSPEYPAVFGIIAGISILLIVAVTFIVVGLFSMEPAKDSIIYRMTNTRMKKD